MPSEARRKNSMARDIILDICDALMSVTAASDIEEMCRYEVAQEMENRDRLLDDAEIEDIVGDVVGDEALADPFDSIDGDGVVRMTDVEWENTPDSYKVIDTDGEESAIIEGAIYKVSLREDTRTASISAKISSEIESAWRLRNAAHGIAADMDSYMREAAGDIPACPDCGSDDQTAVWYDDDVQYIHCNACGSEYCIEISPEDATVEELTVEDVPIYEDEGESVFGSVFYDGELGWTWQIWRNGECVEQQLADSPDEAYGIFNRIKREYEELAIGESLKGSEDGEPFEIEDIVGDDLVCGSCRKSRVRAAVDIAMGTAFVDDSELYALDIEAGDCYRNLVGEEIEVIEADRHGVLYLASEIDEHTHDYRSDYHKANRNAFVGHLVDKGYLS